MDRVRARGRVIYYGLTFAGRRRFFLRRHDFLLPWLVRYRLGDQLGHGRTIGSGVVMGWCGLGIPPTWPRCCVGIRRILGDS